MVNFEVGDVVRLKSGGPKMIVSKIFDGNSYVEVTWFTKTEDLRKDAIRYGALERVEQESA